MFQILLFLWLILLSQTKDAIVELTDCSLTGIADAIIFWNHSQQQRMPDAKSSACYKMCTSNKYTTNSQ